MSRALLPACGWILCVGLARAQSAPGELTPASEADSFEAVARVEPEARAERAVDVREDKALRASLGDSFDAVESLPGTVPVFSGVPYLLVRGAAPSGTTQFYDGVPVPALFHLALGPEIVPPSLSGGLDFYPGVAPARYGRRTGAALVARGPEPAQHALAAELEGRLLDAHGLVRARQPGLALHGRLGYPNLMLDAVGSSAELAYWDYLVRADLALDARDQLTLFALGAGDHIGDRLDHDDDITLQFHRVLARLTRTLPRLSVGGQLYGGYERGSLGSDLRAQMLRLGPATWIELRRRDGTRVRVGLDMEAKLARVRDDDDEGADGGLQVPPGVSGNIEPGLPQSPPVQRDRFLPDVEPDASLSAGPEDFVERTPLAGKRERNAAGAYVELALAPADPVEIELGLRSDGWLLAGRVEHALDPRALVRVHALPGLSLHAGAGSSHQAAVSPLPIPGLTDLELDHGLQRALQSELGAELELPGGFRASATGFFHRFTELAFLELILDCEGNSDPLAPLLFGPGLGRRVPLCEGRGLPRGDGRAYGAELLLRRSVLERFGGWLSYTLAWGEATANDGTDFVPQYDVRHVLNAVLTQDWGAGFSSGLRLHYRSGKPAVNTVFDFSDFSVERLHIRLPAFFRADVTLAYRWPMPFGAMAVSLQFLNVTFSREATKRDCNLADGANVICEVDYQPAIVLPNVGLRAEL